MRLSESTLLIVAAAITSIAGLFDLIGLTTPKWLRSGVGLWNCDRVCSNGAAALVILALILMIIALIFLVLHLVRQLPRLMHAVPFVALLVANFFLIVAKATYLRDLRIVGYSYELIVTSHVFVLVATVITAFWFGRTMADKPTISISRTTVASHHPGVMLPSGRPM
jgi:hypothetical protein